MGEKRSQSVRCRMDIQMEMPNGQFVCNPTQAGERGKSEQRSSVGLSHVEGMKSLWPSTEHASHKHRTSGKRTCGIKGEGIPQPVESVEMSRCTC